ncbi:MAG: sulfatase-like hydrolase/transferase, partial [Acidobacteriota bacterium]
MLPRVPRRPVPRHLVRVIALLLVVSACASDSPPRTAPRHVLLITIDTLRADTLGFAGHAGVATPVLDRLAATGRVFDSAHAHCVTTLPSHASILTGLYPFEHGVRHNGGFVLADSVPALAPLLQAAGFATGAFVGAFPLDARFGLQRGFDVYDDEIDGASDSLFTYSERSGDVVVDRASAWWDRHRQSRRFLWLHLFDPHAPYEPPEPFASQFAASPYLGEVSAVDHYLAPMIERFLGGDEEPTLIVVTSDHGEALGEHGEATHGLFAYEPTLKVPLVVWGPGVEPGVDSRQARHIDIAPTILQALGLDPLPASHGRSLLDPEENHPTTSFFEALSPHLDFGWAPLRGVLQGGEKYIDLPLPELYDLPTDPAESENLWASGRRRARELAEVLPEESSWPPARGEVSSAEAERLRALGYLGGPTVHKARYTAADDPKNLVDLDRKVSQLARLSSTGQAQEAIALAREILAQRPTMGVVYIYLSSLLLQTGDYAEAIRTMRTAEQQGVASRDLLRQLGLTLITVGQAQEALQVLAPLAEDPS